MKGKKGFIFIETLVVVAVLTLSLLYTYATYNTAVIKEKTRLRYDDAAFMYRTYYIAKYFHDFRLDMVANNLDASKTSKWITGFNCSNESIFVNAEVEKSFCESLLSNFHVNNIYLTFNDLSFVQDCTDQKTGKCVLLQQVRDDAANYLKTIGGKNIPGYRIIVEYKESKEGNTCSNNCVYYYSSLNVGEF